LNKEDAKKVIKQTAKDVIAAKSQPPVTTASLTVEGRKFQGPLPPPEILGAYSTVVQNGAERIMQMAEKEQKHAHSIEIFSIAAITIGQVLGFTIVIAATVGGMILVWQGKPISGFTGFFSGLALLVGGGYIGRKKQTTK
jgi:uncharacterized membrane protein